MKEWISKLRRIQLPRVLRELITPDSRSPREQLEGKLRISLARFHDGVSMKQAKLEREFPDDTPEEIQAKLSAWLLDRPHDQPGVPVTWPRE